jgi:hypothetical protein
MYQVIQAEKYKKTAFPVYVAVRLVEFWNSRIDCTFLMAGIPKLETNALTVDEGGGASRLLEKAKKKKLPHGEEASQVGQRPCPLRSEPVSDLRRYPSRLRSLRFRRTASAVIERSELDILEGKAQMPAPDFQSESVAHDSVETIEALA